LQKTVLQTAALCFLLASPRDTAFPGLILRAL
jgi:hypothetical protein